MDGGGGGIKNFKKLGKKDNLKSASQKIGILYVLSETILLFGLR